MFASGDHSVSAARRRGPGTKSSERTAAKTRYLMALVCSACAAQARNYVAQLLSDFVGFACRPCNFLRRFLTLNLTSTGRNLLWAHTKHLNMPNMPATRTVRNKWA